MKLMIKTEEDRRTEALAAHQARITAAIDAHVEAQARALFYNGAAHLASYVASTNPLWSAEAKQFVAWRDSVWTTALTLLQEARLSARVPGQEEIIALLPPWEMP